MFGVNKPRGYDSPNGKLRKISGIFLWTVQLSFLALVLFWILPGMKLLFGIFVLIHIGLYNNGRLFTSSCFVWMSATTTAAEHDRNMTVLNTGQQNESRINTYNLNMLHFCTLSGLGRSQLIPGYTVYINISRTQWRGWAVSPGSDQKDTSVQIYDTWGSLVSPLGW